ncbi:MAG: glycosyltransferase [Tannerellaceae bacterium]|jgi:glycosyltransferase involved in cell wall biosynthesis|nr:glycosyltransferase [Tannerellaceae bacterium]
MRRSDKHAIAENKLPVSVIVYTKNECYNLEKYLPSLLEQDYPSYEVIVINDGSTDESDDVLKRFENVHKHLYHTFIPQESKYLSRRKLSLTLGVKAAKNDILLFTEANCKPLSKNWITTMVRNYTGKTDIVLGFCAYRENKSFFHKLISFDNLMVGLQYITSALKKHPFSGNGRNLSYKKTLFFEHKGYGKSLSLHAGDDDLFVNETATPHNTCVEYSKDSIMEMATIECFAIWKEMKVSRAATQHHYKGGQLTFFRLEKLVFFLFLSVVIGSVFAGINANPLTPVIGILLYILLLIIKMGILNKSAQMLQQKFSFGLFPIFEIIQPLVNVYIFIYRIFRGKKDYTFTITCK